MMDAADEKRRLSNKQVSARAKAYMNSPYCKIWLADTPEAERRRDALSTLNDAHYRCEDGDLSIADFAAITEALDLLQQCAPRQAHVFRSFVQAIAEHDPERRSIKVGNALQAIERVLDDAYPRSRID
jgi:hypothetical protein